MPPLVLKQVFNTIYEKSPFFVRPFTSIVTNQICKSFIDPANFNNFSLVDSYLSRDGGRHFLAGGREPTGGDFMVSITLLAICSLGNSKTGVADILTIRFCADVIPHRVGSHLRSLQAGRNPTKHEGLPRSSASETSVYSSGRNTQETSRSEAVTK